MANLARVLTVILLMAAVVTAHAQLRTLPANGKRTMVGESSPLPYVVLGGKKLKLSPGALIFDPNNRTIVHGELPPGADAVYVTDMHGAVSRIYLLTAIERRQLDQKRK